MSVKAASRGVISLFTLKRVRRGAIILGLIFSISVVSQTTGLLAAYPTPESRMELVNSLKTNIGLTIMYGSSEHLDNTVESYATWRTLGIITIIASIWGILATTRMLRGEEESGRWELLVSGPVTARQATARTVAGLVGGLAIAAFITGLSITIAGRAPDINISPGASFLYAITMALGALMFVSVAALTSQLAATRTRAAMIASAVLGLSFLVRAVASTSESFRWLATINPLNWVDHVLPLTGQRSLWLIPIVGFTIAVMSLAVYLSGRRDLEASFLPHRDTAKARLGLLRSPFGLSFRLMRGPIISWLVGITVPSVLFGVLALTAAEALSSAGGLNDTLGKLLGQQSASAGAKLFLGVGFMLINLFVMALVVAAMQGVRHEEAGQTLDSLLVRPVRRLRWLSGRITIAVLWILAACLWASVACWAAAATQHSGLGIFSLLLAGANMIAPNLFLLGMGLATFGLRPRWTTTVMYSVIGWSFLAETLGSALDLPSWILNTSLLRHVTAAPFVNPNWASAAILAGLGLALGILGAAAFSRRDLQNE